MQKTRIAVLVSGGGTNLQALIDAQNKSSLNGEIVLIISDRKEAYALQRAAANGIEALLLDRSSIDFHSFNRLLSQKLKEAEVELVVLAGFLSILNKEFVKEFENRIINIHPSLIPAFCGKGYYGMKVHEAVIAYGAKISGATVHFVDEGTDSGPIILQDTVTVEDEDTPESLAAKVLELEHSLLVKAVSLYCDKKIDIQGRRVKIKKQQITKGGQS